LWKREEGWGGGGGKNPASTTTKFLNNYQKEQKTNNSLSFPSKINIDDKVYKNRTNGGDCFAKMEAMNIIHSI
jgi:hypothetical protein